MIVLALQQFEKALAASPNHCIGLKGKLAAARKLKEPDVERGTLEQLQRNVKRAGRGSAGKCLVGCCLNAWRADLMQVTRRVPL